MEGKAVIVGHFDYRRGRDRYDLQFCSPGRSVKISNAASRIRRIWLDGAAWSSFQCADGSTSGEIASCPGACMATRYQKVIQVELTSVVRSQGDLSSCLPGQNLG